MLPKAGPGTEIKWSNSSPAVRLAMLEEVVKAGQLVAGVSACVMEKGWANPAHASRGTNIRYNYAARIAMEKGGLFLPERKKRIILTIDQRNIAATDSMREHLETLKDLGELCCDVELRAGDSQEMEALQAVDFVAGAITAAYTTGEWKYVNFLKRGGITFAIRAPGWKRGKNKAGTLEPFPI